MKLYLCVDMSGGLCDRICLGDEGLINNANTSIDCWNDFEENIEKMLKHVSDIENALSILDTDNFKIVEMEEGKIYTLENVILDYSENNLVTFVDERLAKVIKVKNIKFNEEKMFSIY